jgi:hypothetical protein
MTVHVLAQTYKPQSLVYKAMPQDYSSEYIVAGTPTIDYTKLC